MAEPRCSRAVSEEIESKKHRHEHSTERSENGGIESRKQAIALGLSKTRERGERVVKEMADSALKKK